MAFLYDTGTVAAVAGSDELVLSGGAWTANVVRSGDPIYVGGGYCGVIKEVIDTTHLKIAPSFNGATASGLGYSIITASPEWGQNRTLNEQVSDFLQQLQLQGAGNGFDADLLDGLHASSFARVDTSNTLDGDLVLTGASHRAFVLRSDVPAYRAVSFRGASGRRVDFGVDNAPEDGGNAGSNFYIDCFDDVDGWLGRSLGIERKTGIVRLPKQPGFSASDSSAIGTATGPIGFNSFQHNVGMSITDNNSRVWIPSDGIWLIAAQISADSGTWDFGDLEIRRNGAIVGPRSVIRNANNAWINGTILMLLPLNAGDYIEAHRQWSTHNLSNAVWRSLTVSLIH